MLNAKNKKKCYLLLLFVFCFSHVTFGWLALSTGTVYLHKNHFHIYQFEDSKELNEVNKANIGGGVSFDLLAINSADPSNYVSFLKQLIESPFLPTKNISSFDLFKSYSLSTFTCAFKEIIKTELFLIKSSYLI